MVNIIFQPASGKAARKHYALTVESPVPLSQINNIFDRYEHDFKFPDLSSIYPGDSICVWGIRPGRGRSQWPKIQRGDKVLFYRNRNFYSVANVIEKVHHPVLARALWGETEKQFMASTNNWLGPQTLPDLEYETWEYIYFIDYPKQINIPAHLVHSKIGYSSNYNHTGMSVITDQRAMDILELVVESRKQNLIRYEDYTRKQVHRIFSPNTTFNPQAGTWGLHGIVAIPNRDRDFVFFVTFGQSQADHEFDESIDENGILTWQSQPRNGFNSSIIKKLIDHDDLKNNIYLFLRRNKNDKYTYLGNLMYLEHDIQKQYPVHFKWQIIDWNIYEPKLEFMGLSIHKESSDSPVDKPKPGLKHTAIPKSIRKGSKNRKSSPKLSGGRIAQDADNKQLGDYGERLVVQHEEEKLDRAKRKDLRVRHIALEEGDGAGYDVLSYTEHGQPMYIEVKTTRGSAKTPFYISPNEIEFSISHEHSYYLYRLYECDTSNSSASYYTYKGKIDDLVELQPINYRATLKQSPEIHHPTNSPNQPKSK